MTRTHAHGMRRGLPPALVACTILLVAGVGGALLLHSAGAISIPFLEKDEAPEKPAFDRTGRIPVPISVRPITAYSRVGREHLLNPRTLQIATVWMRPQEVPEAAAKNARDVLGRVLRRDKQAGQIFMQDEFYPRGTRPGPTAGIPPGKRAMRLKTAEVPGLHGLQQGDHFDIVMTLEVEVEEAPRARTASHGRLDVKGPYAPLHAAQLVPEPDEKPVIKRRRAEVRVVVQNGVVIQPVHQRHEIGEKASLLQGTSLTSKPVEELIIAVEPKEVAQLNQALALEATLQVAMRSGQLEAREGKADEGSIPDLAVEVELAAPAEGADADKPKDENYRLVEVIVGGEKRLMAVPKEQAKQP